MSRFIPSERRNWTLGKDTTAELFFVRGYVLIALDQVPQLADLSWLPSAKRTHNLFVTYDQSPPATEENRRANSFFTRVAGIVAKSPKIKCFAFELQNGAWRRIGSVLTQHILHRQ